MHSANCAGAYRDLAIVGRKTSKIEQLLPKPTSGGAQIAKPNVRFRG